MVRRPLTILALILLPSTALAHTLESETSVSSDSTIETLTYDGRSDESGWIWNAGYTFTHSQDASGPVPVDENTNELNAGAGWEGDALSAGGGLTYSITPGEQLHSVGPTFYAGYTLKFGAGSASKRGKAAPKPKVKAQVRPAAVPENENEDESEADAGDEFAPSVGVKATVARNDYTADLSSSGPRARTAAVSIARSSAAGEIDAAFAEWVSFKASYTAYSYNRDISTFLDRLSSPKAVRFSGASALSNSVSGFSEYLGDATLTLVPFKSWDVDLETSLSRSASDGSLTRGYKAKVGHELTETWRLALGIEHDSSPSLIQNVYSAALSYEF